jgi:hypothetical protein
MVNVNPDGVLLSRADKGADPKRIQNYRGFTDTLLDVIGTFFTLHGLEWDGRDIYSVFRFFGTSYYTWWTGWFGPAKSQFNTLFPDDARGLTLDNNEDLITCGITLGNFYQMIGFSSTIQDVFVSPVSQIPAEHAWNFETDDLWAACDSGRNNYWFDGFSDTVLDIQTPHGNGSLGVTRGEDGDLMEMGVLPFAINRYQGFTDTRIDWFYPLGDGISWGISWGGRGPDGSRRERQSRAHKRANRGRGGRR